MNYYEIDADAEGQQKIDNYINHLAGMKASLAVLTKNSLNRLLHRSG